MFYRQTTDPSLLARATSELRATFDVYDDFQITNLFIATWDAVGYYSRNTDKVAISVICICTVVFTHTLKFLWYEDLSGWSLTDLENGVGVFMLVDRLIDWI